MPMPLAAEPNSALVARTEIGANQERYLLVTPAGAPDWVADPAAATPFASMREATRMALRLPSSLRAFGLPRAPGVTTH